MCITQFLRTILHAAHCKNRVSVASMVIYRIMLDDTSLLESSKPGDSLFGPMHGGCLDQEPGELTSCGGTCRACCISPAVMAHCNAVSDETTLEVHVPTVSTVRTWKLNCKDGQWSRLLRTQTFFFSFNDIHIYVNGRTTWLSYSPPKCTTCFPLFFVNSEEPKLLIP